MNRNPFSLLAIMALVSLLFVASPTFAQISLGTAQNFAVLGGSTVTNTGTSAINGNVGVSLLAGAGLFVLNRLSS